MGRVATIALALAVSTSACGSSPWILNDVGSAVGLVAGELAPGRGVNNWGRAGHDLQGTWGSGFSLDYDTFRVDALQLIGTFVFQGERFALEWVTGIPFLKGTRLTSETAPGGVVTDSGTVTTIYRDAGAIVTHAGGGLVGEMHLPDQVGSFGTYSLTYAPEVDSQLDPLDWLLGEGSEASAVAWSTTFTAEAEVCIDGVWPSGRCASGPVRFTISSTNGLTYPPTPRGTYTEHG